MTSVATGIGLDRENPIRWHQYGPDARELAFPLGGIGTGNVSIGARGQFQDWEIFNRPGKGTTLPNTFWALRTDDGRTSVTKILEGPIAGPHTGALGYHPSTGGGLPRFGAATVSAAYPFVRVRYADPAVPLDVELEAFTPLVPLDAAGSGIPCAVLTFHLTNTTGQPLSVSLAGSMANPACGAGFGRFGNPLSRSGQTVNRLVRVGAFQGLHLTSQGIDSGSVDYGEACLATNHADVTAKPAWLRGAWHDDLREYWNDLASDGRLDDLGYVDAAPAGHIDTGALAGHLDILPGESTAVRFVLAWYFPNRRASWHDRVDAPVVRTNYGARFEGALDVIRHVEDNLFYLEDQTRRFAAAMTSATLPAHVIDAILAGIVPLRSPTCFWLEGGGFYGYEGCFDDAGSCAGTCTHVWSYAYAVALLFPELERRMRTIEFVGELEPDGYLPFRSLKVFGEEAHWQAYEAGRRDPSKRPPAAADGQAGSIIRVYREWLFSGDQAWLAEVWPGVKAAYQYAQRQWDPDGDGVLGSKQHTTYDIDFEGPNPLCTFYFLAATHAVGALATAMGDDDVAEECLSLATSGIAAADARMWNGKYFQQVIPTNVDDRYQHGTGCLSDQLLGQLHSRLLGLPDVVLPGRSALCLTSIFEANFRETLAEHHNSQRALALNDEGGLLLCSWPQGGEPTFPFIYSDEVWTGSEYQVAAHLLSEGNVDAALQIVGAVRRRHDGRVRNPWNEREAGHHYARSMSSWALLLAAAGFRCDLSKNLLAFEPQLHASSRPDQFMVPWFAGRGWGIYEQRLDASTGSWLPSVRVLGGDLTGVTVNACGRSWQLGSEHHQAFNFAE